MIFFNYLCKLASRPESIGGKVKASKRRARGKCSKSEHDTSDSQCHQRRATSGICSGPDSTVLCSPWPTGLLNAWCERLRLNGGHVSASIIRVQDSATRNNSITWTQIKKRKCSLTRLHHFHSENCVVYLTSSRDYRIISHSLEPFNKFFGNVCMVPSTTLRWSCTFYKPALVVYGGGNLGPVWSGVDALQRSIHASNHSNKWRNHSCGSLFDYCQLAFVGWQMELPLDTPHDWNQCGQYRRGAGSGMIWDNLQASAGGCKEMWCCRHHHHHDGRNAVHHRDKT
jgi:hypothetical protein